MTRQESKSLEHRLHHRRLVEDVLSTCLICKRDEYPLAGREWDKRARKNNTFIGRPLKAEDASAAEFGLEHIRRNLYVLLQSLQKDKEIQGSQWYV